MAEIVGILAGLVAPALELGKCFKKQFNYLFCLKTNIKNLQVAAAKMEDKRVDLQDKVEAAKRNREVILREVETWLADAQETQRTAKQIMEAQIPARIFSLKPRYSLSRKAMKKTEILIKLQDTCNFSAVAIPRTMIDSRKETEEDIIMAIKDLQVAAKHLEDKQVDLLNKVDAAKRNEEVILREVETWLADAEETQRTAQEIIATHQLIPAAGIISCTLKPRYSLSRKAMKKTESMNKLRANCTFDHVSNPAPPASMGQTPPLRPTRGIGSRMKTEEDIILAMRDQDVYVIGVCGMGGVGKTTMAKQIMNRAREKEEGLFDEVVMVAVGQQAEMLKIQHDIADWLGIKFEEETLAPRAIRLRARLQVGKRKLIVIDDVWGRIDLEELGIPCESGSCTILLTSRDSGVLHQMNAKRVFTIQILSDEEAWSMFKENAGTCVDDPDLLQKAREVAGECKCLPLALVVVGKTLNDEKNIRVWSDALTQLRSSNPVDIEEVIEGVYNPIKLSIDFLYSPSAKSLLFLCSSFPEDWNISLEDLMFYSFGLCMLGNNINSLEGARNRIATLIKTLKSRSLILDSEYGKCYVKMHDVVRDVAIFIAAQEKHAIVEISSSNEWSRKNPYSDWTMLSVVVVEREKKIELLPMELGATFPNLRFLWMQNHDKYGGRHSMSVDFLKGMQQLKVLHINKFSFGSTLQSMEQLKTLHTLRLEHCDDLETLSPVGELSSLEILSFRECHSIVELPVEIGRLNRLRLLEVSFCERLKTIMPGVISSLGRLEELKMLGSFKGWESVEEGSNVSVVELQSLSNLRCLEIEINDWRLATQELPLLSSKIVKYDISVGTSSSFEWKINPNYEKKLSVRFPKGETLSSIGKWIDVFARSADGLILEGDAYTTFDFALGCQNKKHLELRDCPTVEKFGVFPVLEKFGVFPVLEKLRLESLPNFVEMCDGSNNNSFAKLNHIEITNCSKLRSLFTSSLEVIRSLSQQLESLIIKGCESMEEVFSIELLQEDIVSPITFPKLERLRLRDLPSLTTLCKGNIIHDDMMINIQFPHLVDLRIDNCPKLINIYSDQNQLLNSSSSTAHIQDSIPLLCHEKVKFGSLKELWIGGYENMSYVWCHHIPHPFFGGLQKLEISKCANINNLFSYSIAANLVNLKQLTIQECPEMVYLIADDKAETKPLPIIFHKLEEVKLIGLPKLASFCEGGWDLQFQLLRRVVIEKCPDMKGFSLGSICAPNLKEFTVDCQNKFTNHEKKLSLKFPMGKTSLLSIGKWIDVFARSADYLYLEGDASNTFDFALGCYTQNKQHLELIDCPTVEKLGVFPVLETLCLERLPNLIEIWDDSNNSFAKLTQIVISGCGKLSSVFTSSLEVIRNLSQQLETLVISECESMEEVFSIELLQDIVSPITFPKLKFMSLKCLKSLTALCKGNIIHDDMMINIQFPQLVDLIIVDCPKLINIYSDQNQLLNSSSSTAHIQDSIPLLCHEKVKFGSLKTLRIEGGYENMSYVWCHHIPHPFFGGLEQLVISKCANINNLFSYSIAANLGNLFRLTIEECNEMVHVIADDKAETTVPLPIIFHKLEVLKLIGLPKLASFCEGGWDLQFPSLRVVEIGKCPDMKGFSLGSICAPNLMEFTVDCQNKFTIHEMKMSLFFPEGETLLLSLGNWIDVFARSADYLYLEGDASNTFDFALGCYTQNKKYLELFNCLTVEKLSVFPVLETLCLERLPNLIEIWDDSNNSFAKLTHIWISGCGKLRSVFTSSLEVITSLSQQLEWLHIEDCESMEEVFSIELLQEDIVSPITFPNLEYLWLYNLPSLTTLCKGNISQDDMINNNQFPLLGELIIGNCPKLVTSFINIDSDLNCASSSSSAHIQDSIPRHALFCNEKVKFGSLKVLGIGEYENINSVWCHHIPRPFFGGLEKLGISTCANINNLFSYSIAANLGNLKHLTIGECNEMVYVIADDKAETTVPLTLIFHKLEVVKLVELPKLQSFCEGNWELLFPSLREVEIEKCPDMKGFSLGSISTPNLKEFKVDGQEKSVEDFIKYPWQQEEP